MNTDYFLYMAESEGMDDIVSTKRAKIEAAIKDFINLASLGEDPNEHIATVLHAHGLTEALLTDGECEYIVRKVESAI